MQASEIYVVAKSSNGGYMIATHEEWLKFKYCGTEDIMPEWYQLDFRPDQLQAAIMLYRILEYEIIQDLK